MRSGLTQQIQDTRTQDSNLLIILQVPAYGSATSTHLRLRWVATNDLGFTSICILSYMHQLCHAQLANEKTMALLESWEVGFLCTGVSVSIAAFTIQGAVWELKRRCVHSNGMLGLMCSCVLNAQAEIESHPSYGPPPKKYQQGSLISFRGNLLECLHSAPLPRHRNIQCRPSFQTCVVEINI